MLALGRTVPRRAAVTPAPYLVLASTRAASTPACCLRSSTAAAASVRFLTTRPPLLAQSKSHKKRRPAPAAGLAATDASTTPTPAAAAASTTADAASAPAAPSKPLLDDGLPDLSAYPADEDAKTIAARILAEEDAHREAERRSWHSYLRRQAMFLVGTLALIYAFKGELSFDNPFDSMRTKRVDPNASPQSPAKPTTWALFGPINELTPEWVKQFRSYLDLSQYMPTQTPEQQQAAWLRELEVRNAQQVEMEKAARAKAVAEGRNPATATGSTTTPQSAASKDAEKPLSGVELGMRAQQHAWEATASVRDQIARERAAAAKATDLIVLPANGKPSVGK